MAKTNWQDPKSSEIISPHISGLQEAVGKLEESLGISSIAATDIELSEVYISEEDRYRIYQAPEGKRNWLSSPTPIIKKNGVEITTGFIIEYGGGAIVFTTPLISTDVVTADATYTVKEATSLVAQINNSLATELYTITTGFAAGWSGTLIYGITKNDILILSIPQMTKDSDILGTEDVFTLPVGFRPKSVFSAVKTEITGVDISDNNIQDSNVQIQLVYSGILRFRNTGLVTSNVRRVSGANLFTIL